MFNYFAVKLIILLIDGVDKRNNYFVGKQVRGGTRARETPSRGGSSSINWASRPIRGRPDALRTWIASPINAKRVDTEPQWARARVTCRGAHAAGRARSRMYSRTPGFSLVYNGLHLFGISAKLPWADAHTNRVRTVSSCPKPGAEPERARAGPDPRAWTLGQLRVGSRDRRPDTHPISSTGTRPRTIPTEDHSRPGSLHGPPFTAR